jgi:hypothetical protein
VSSIYWKFMIIQSRGLFVNNCVYMYVLLFYLL